MKILIRICLIFTKKRNLEKTLVIDKIKAMDRKIEKLEKKHLAVYLPYDLEMVSPANGMHAKSSFILRGMHVSKNGYNGNDFKPELRPMSDLVKETTHDGKTIIPILELYKISVSEDVEEYKIKATWDDNLGFACGVRVLDSTDEVQIFSYSEKHGFATQNTGLVDVIKNRKTVLTQNQLECWEKMFELHFDVFGLIDAGLAEIKV